MLEDALKNNIDLNDENVQNALKQMQEKNLQDIKYLKDGIKPLSE